jgi:hypothetical protein
MSGQDGFIQHTYRTACAGCYSYEYACTVPLHAAGSAVTGKQRRTRHVPAAELVLAACHRITHMAADRLLQDRRQAPRVAGGRVLQLVGLAISPPHRRCAPADERNKSSGSMHHIVIPEGIQWHMGCVVRYVSHKISTTGWAAGFGWSLTKSSSPSCCLRLRRCSPRTGAPTPHTPSGVKLRGRSSQASWTWVEAAWTCCTAR